jgi:hypothetical protein
MDKKSVFVDIPDKYTSSFVSPVGCRNVLVFVSNLTMTTKTIFRLWASLTGLAVFGWLAGAALLLATLVGTVTMDAQKLIGCILICMVVGTLSTTQLGKYV